MYGNARYLQEDLDSNENLYTGRTKTPEDEWKQRNRRELDDLRAMNANIQIRSAEKALRGKTVGPVNCSPENVTVKHDPETEHITVKQEHTYIANGFPDIGPDPLDTTEETRGTKRTLYTNNTIMPMKYLKERATLRDSNRNHRTIQIDKIHERQ